MEIHIILIILALHFVGDFILQTDYMAKNKSTCNRTLSNHVIMYSIPLMMFNPAWGLINGVIHGVVDYVSSRVTSHLHKKGDIHNFFVVIGFDQFIHVATLMFTYWYMFIK